MANPFTTSIDMLTGTQPAEASVGVTADTTGPAIDTSKRQMKSIQFKVANHTSGNTVFTVEICNGDPDVAANWVAYNRLIPNLTGTNAQTDAHVASVTIASESSTFVFFPIGDFFRYIWAKSDVTTDGSSFAYLETA